MSPPGVFTMYICFHLHEQPNSKDAQTNRDKITPNLPELSLSLVFSGHAGQAAHSVAFGSVSTPCLPNGDQRKVD